ncbi:MAG: PAS domain-containing sensor histidine kinase [Saprospiraceae bacterium]|nr:PAS domain-containing sensor histidine kinase [Saprospiraceae bacterium]
MDGYLVVDSKNRIESLSPSLKRWLKFHDDQLTGLQLGEPFPEIYNSLISKSNNSWVRNGEGKLFPVRVFKAIVPGSIGNRSAIFLEDLTTRKSLEKELIKTRDQFQGVFTEAVDALVIINSRGVIQNVNPATEKLFGYSGEEMISRNVSMLMPNPHKENHDQYISNYLTSGVAQIIGIGREVPGKKKDGSLFPMRLGVSEVLTEEGSLFTGIIQDLTQQKKAETKILQLNQALEEKVRSRTSELSKTVNKLLFSNKKLENVIQQREKINQALIESEKDLKLALSNEKELGNLKSRFVSMASHEFRTPLSSILSSSELIGMVLEKDQPEKAKKYLDRIEESVNALSGILNDFLSLSRLEEGATEINIEEFLLQDLCQEIIKEFEPLLKDGQKLALEHHVDEVTMLSDKRMLKNILTNLLSNASKYSPKNQPIKCRISNVKGEVCIDITDHGMGIPEEDIPYLFSRFFRASNATNIQGTGLGLHIIKRYLSLLGGRIRLRSELEKGSTFTVYIPIKTTTNEENISR